MGTISITVAIIIAVACAVVCGVLGFVFGGIHRKNTAEKIIGSASEEATRILNRATSEAEARKREAILEARDDIHKMRSETEAELRERRTEIGRREKRIAQKEEHLDKKADTIERKEDRLNQKLKAAEQKLSEAETVKKDRIAKLEEISGLSRERAKALLLEHFDSRLEKEKAAKILDYKADLKEKESELAREAIVTAIQRCAADVVAEAVVSTVSIPDDSIKGRIIGREGRNISLFEQLTGVDLIVDDTPETITISCFDPVRREKARVTLEKLVADGRINAKQIERTYEKASAEVDRVIRKAGEKAIVETGVSGLSRELTSLLGSLKFRTSYGRNVLLHSIEVCRLSGLMARELGLDVKLAKRAGLLHDIGKAVDHRRDGTHIELGVEIAKRARENETVINAIASHHGDCEPTSMIACIVRAADAISAARPGARVENLQTYIQRLRDLEEIAKSFRGIKDAFAIRAGREIRIIVSPEKISDAKMTVLAEEIAQRIESELRYPGQIKVSLIRETRVSAIAK